MLIFITVLGAKPKFVSSYEYKTNLASHRGNDYCHYRFGWIPDKLDSQLI